MDLTPHHFNPAGRLYELLAYCHTKANVSTHRAWSDYMGLDPESSLFYAGIAGIQALPAQARAAFDALPADVLLLADADGAHEALTRAEAALRDGARDLTANISQVTQRYNEGDLVHIKQCGKFLESELHPLRLTSRRSRHRSTTSPGWRTKSSSSSRRQKTCRRKCASLSSNTRTPSGEQSPSHASKARRRCCERGTA